jgi:hypothetical protein
VGKDDREKTPPTGTAIPRPRLKAVEAEPTVPVVDFARLPSSPPPPPSPLPSRPANPTLKELYDLIDQRITPQIVERISSTPPAAPTVEPAPRPSLPVRVAKGSPKWVAYLISALMIAGQAIAAASQEEYRGPIVQGVKLIAWGVAEFFSEDPAAPPETTPE